MRNNTRIGRITIVVAVCLLLSQAIDAWARTLRFAMVPKSMNESFFEPVGRGCRDAAQALGDAQCLFRGPQSADPRLQDDIISNLVDEGVDGIAVSVINSQFLQTHSIAKARKAGIPVVTFDSDFSMAVLLRDPHIREAYIGTDNYKLGRELGMTARHLRPEGGVFCIISGHKTAPGLQLRMRGVLAALASTPGPVWVEYDRCPLYSHDDPDKALEQLTYIMDISRKTDLSVDTLIVLGDWPQQDERKYREAMLERQDVLANQSIVIVGTDEGQLDMLSSGFTHANVGQSPYSMGKTAVETLYDLVTGKSVPDVITTPIKRCVGTPPDTFTCTERP